MSETKDSSPIRVALADDHAVLRAGLRALIEQEADMTVVAEAATATSAIACVSLHSPDVLVLDLAMPGGGSVEAIRTLRAEHPRTRVLVLTMHDDASYLREVIAAGGAGYVTKRAADTELLSAIRSVHAGRSYVNVSLSDHPPPPTGRPSNTAVRDPSVLSEREREVLRQVALGHTNKEIAQQIHISIKSVESYRARVAEKLALSSRADLVRYALAAGLIGREADTAKE